jgi:multiple sugar transport system ATP-binding protein
MGRAIVREPRVFLMDEPLSNLDAKLRVETRANIAALQARLGATTIYVTHDQVEAMTMGHRVALLKDGVLQQVGTPRELYREPANAFVAGFLGSPPMNLRTVSLVDGGAVLGGALVPLRPALLEAAHRAGLTTMVLGLRPESIGVAADGVRATVDLVEELGADAYLYCSLPGDDPHERKLVVRFDGREPPRIGDAIALAVEADAEHGFHPVTQQRL